jgi:Ca2+-transporting ATPase
MEWFQTDVKQTFRKLNTSEHGLSEADVNKRLEEYGPNRLPAGRKVSRIKILVHQFQSPLIYILLIAATVTVFLREYIDTGVIMAVVILNAIIGYIQEFKAEASIRALKKLTVPKARVLREGTEREIDSGDLVPGDIVLLSSGSKVPADLRLIREIELKVDESLLTGESLPHDKTTAPIKEDNLIAGDQKNMAFMGTIVVSGRGKGIVVKTGQKTVLGQIAEEVREVTEVRTPLQAKFENLARLIGFFVLGFSALILMAGTLLGEKLSTMFMVAVATAVSAVPEGLPVAVTIAMAIGVSKMAQRNAIIRKLPAVETLGNTTVICSDKTGTLTRNEMTVRLIYDGTHTYELTGSGYDPGGEILREKIPITKGERKDLIRLLRIGLLCNESNIYEEDDQYKVDGDPTEGALIVSAMKAELNPEEEKESYQLTAMIPFESERGYMATLHRHRGKKIIFVKGAPEKILDMCASHMPKGCPKIKEINYYSNEFAKEGLRVIALAYKDVPPEKEDLCHEDIRKDLIYAGLQGMMDPPREESLSAVEGCKEAGIRTVMVTGDYAVTAAAISRQLGIGGDRPHTLEGREIESIDDEVLTERTKDVSIYARVSPQHKLRIVQQFVNLGEVVAVTGDGVNDAPALKAAHIGIAMGRKGTDVAKESSDMVVTDDNFASIVHAVEEGRIVYDNIRKVTLFLLSCGFGELLAIVATIFMRLPIPYIPAQILWLNLITNGLQDVALAFEPGEKGVIKRPPRSPGEGILTSLIIQRTLLMGIILAAGTLYIFISALKAGVPLERARTAALTTMVFFQFYQAFNCRSETQSIFSMSLITNPFLLFSMIAAFFAQMAVIYVPALQWIFRTVPLSSGELIQIALVTITVIVAVEIDKAVRRKGPSERGSSMQLTKSD